MNYRVDWMPGAEAELAELWLDSSSRAAVTAAANRIDTALETDAHEQGESRTGGQRILLDAPLGVLFLADPGTRFALVIHVWMFATR